MDTAIEARGLVKTYRGDVRALDGVSLVAESGTVFGLLGPNGAGKSTTVKILTTLSRPDARLARVGARQRREDLHSCRLAGAVGPEQAEHRARLGDEAHAVEGAHVAAIGLHQPSGFDCRVHFLFLPAICCSSSNVPGGSPSTPCPGSWDSVVALLLDCQTV